MLLVCYYWSWAGINFVAIKRLLSVSSIIHHQTRHTRMHRFWCVVLQFLQTLYMCVCVCKRQPKTYQRKEEKTQIRQKPTIQQQSGVFSSYNCSLFQFAVHMIGLEGFGFSWSHDRFQPEGARAWFGYDAPAPSQPANGVCQALS